MRRDEYHDEILGPGFRHNQSGKRECVAGPRLGAAIGKVSSD